ncbi:MAG: class I SAM-dependent methyltransferase [Salinarimonadaceae bacterium]|nr:MAG: class I SAM-dependent methyltransferase [Salinarimonadaceae bacterium]
MTASAEGGANPIQNDDESFFPVSPENLSEATRGLPLLLRPLVRIVSRFPVGTLNVILPDGRRLGFRGAAPGPHGEMIIRDPIFVRRLIIGGDLGFAEGYMRGEWESSDLTQLMLFLAANHRVGAKLTPGRAAMRIWQRLRHFLNRNSRTGARRNIHAHYDLGNAFYETWLDRSMTYSSAVFAAGDNDLESAQRRKYETLARATGIEPNDHVLEIGCGWGGFAQYAATEIGCKVTGLTISQEQYDYACERVRRAGLEDRVSIVMRDYRDETGTYDRIVSIEMFEAVGEAYWRTFFDTMRDRLRAGGRAGLQLITIREEAFAGYRREIDFIRRYIFPGGMLPPPSALTGLSAQTGFGIVSDKGFAADYASTLAIWRDRFDEAWPKIAQLGFDERFRKLWRYYLTYCEVGFATRNIDVRQMVFAKPA